MALTTDQKADLLFKKYLGLGSTGNAFNYFNETKNGRAAIYPDQIWAQYDSIPDTATEVPTIVTQIVDDVLVPIPGHTQSFSSILLIDAVPFNFDLGGSYVPILKKFDNTVLPTGQNDWFVDTEAGIVTFYGGLPSGVDNSNPPKITFWRYIGSKGAGGGGGGGGGTLKDFMSGQIESPTVDNMYYLVANNPSYMTITSMSISLYSGTGTASLKVDNVSVGGISNIPLQTTETTYSSSFVSGQPMQTGSRLILELNDMSVGAGRLYFTIALTRTLTA